MHNMGVCECFTGFDAAPDCSLRNCPLGPTWSDSATANDSAHNLAECSNRGKCDRNTGQCSCETMFEGSACKRLACPNDCSGRDRCLSAKALARMEDPGILRKSSGCTSTEICSEVNAYQTPWAVLWVLMYPQPKVAVSWTGGVGSVCIVSGNNIQVTFLQDFGDLPLLIPGGTNLGQTSGTDPPLITAQKVVTGDKESDICSSHGTCDEDKGICQCLDDWMTSDGYGMLVLGVIAAIDPRVQHLLAQENQHVSAMGLALGHQLTDATVRAEGVGPIVL